MRRCLLVLLTWLVAVQMAWAGAAVCCIGELGEAPAGEAVMVLASEAAHTGGEGAHTCAAGHCHCHHAGQATPAACFEAQPIEAAAQLDPIEAHRLKSHIPDGLDRPNWLRA
jgi:hypothetical protein